MSSSRQLAAIVFADIMGYTTLMQEDEEQALQIRNKFEHILQQETAAHGGRIQKMMGDGALCIFSSSIEAARAAVAVQQQMREEPSVPLRIGIHAGDVMVDESDVYGDGVNIASRIESFAVPGGIFLSAKVYDDIKNHKDIQAVCLGRFLLKNVKEPVAIYAVSNEGISVPQNETLQGKGRAPNSTKRIPSALRWLGLVLVIGTASFFFFKKFAPSVLAANTATKAIAILPFHNESLQKGENEFFCNGMMEAVLNNLSQIRSFHVISRQSVEQYRDSKKTTGNIADELGVSYILAGSVQRVGNKVKITTELIDAKADQQIWADSFTSELDDVFSLQENIASEIASALKVKIAPEVEGRLARVPSTNQRALDLYYEAQTNFVKYAYTLPQLESDYNKIQSLCRQALAIDSNLAEAYTLKAKAYWEKVYINSLKKKINKQQLPDSVAAPCEKALTIDNNAVDPMVLLSEYYDFTGKKDRQLSYLEKAITLNPNHFEANLHLAEYYVHSDNTVEKSLHYLKKALRLDPQSITTPEVYGLLSFVYQNILDFEKAKHYAQKAIDQDVNAVAKARGFLDMARILMRVGTGEEVIKYAYEYLKQDSSSNALYFAGEAYCYLKNDCTKAVTLYEKVFGSFSNHPNAHRYAVALWKVGRKEEAAKWMNSSLNKYKEDEKAKGHPIKEYDLAGVYAFLGNKKAAYEILKEPSSNNSVWGWGAPYYILRDPLFENLWHDKEFQDIVANVQAEKAKVRERIQRLEQKGEL